MTNHVSEQTARFTRHFNRTLWVITLSLAMLAVLAIGEELSAIVSLPDILMHR